MNLAIVPMPIFIPSGNSAPMTDKEAHVIISVFIVLNIIWIISLLITLIRNKGVRYFWYHRHDFNEFLMILDIMMAFVWVVIILVYLGIFVSNLW